MFGTPENSIPAEGSDMFAAPPQAAPESIDSPLARATGANESFTESLMPDIQASVDREKLALLEAENEEMRNEIRALRA